ISRTAKNGEKTLKFDMSLLPENAVIRFKRDGDKFKKFGGGTKSLGDFFTDRKIPLWVRGFIPLIAVDNEILAVCGVEISDKIKVTENTENTAYIISGDYVQ
ncbi:MAG: tRNA lysidine(34) synthetase TilS, partial [Clostridia bacterium]|nr:tRNA lysidine(34) synthetase TilS [Clostridia bacterium]